MKKQPNVNVIKYFEHPFKRFLRKLPQYLGMLLFNLVLVSAFFFLVYIDGHENVRQAFIADASAIGLAVGCGYLFMRYAICTNLFGKDKKKRSKR